MRYTQTNDSGAIFASEFLQQVYGHKTHDGWVYLSEERDASLSDGGSAGSGYDISTAPAAGSWFLVDVSHLVPPWTSRVRFILRLNNGTASEEDTTIYTRAHRSTQGLAPDQGNERIRMRAEESTTDSEIMIGVTVEVSCIGGKWLMQHPASASTDNFQLQLLAYR